MFSGNGYKNWEIKWWALPVSFAFFILMMFVLRGLQP